MYNVIFLQKFKRKQDILTFSILRRKNTFCSVLKSWFFYHYFFIVKKEQKLITIIKFQCMYKIIISWFQFTSTFGCKAYQCQISGRIGWLGKSSSWTFGPYFELAINITSRTQNCIASSRSFAQHLFPVPKSHDSSFPRNSSYFKLIRYICIFSLVLTKKYSFILF